MVVLDTFSDLLQLEESIEDVGVLAMTLRTVVVYIMAIILVRLASRRLLAEPSAFDVIVAIMLGSILSRAINGSAPLLPSLVSGAALLAMQRILASISISTTWLGPVVKGGPVLRIRNGVIQKEGLHRAGLTTQDLIELIRLRSDDDEPSRIRLAYLERSGKVSVIPYHTDDREEGKKPRFRSRLSRQARKRKKKDSE